VKRLVRRLQGLAALVALLAVVAGVPWLLTIVGPSFLPHRLPTGSGVIAALTSPDDGSLALAGAVVLAWAAWAVFTASVLLDVLARARRTRPPRIRGLRLPQAGAHRLVGAAILLLATGPVIASTGSSAASAQPLTVASRTSTAAPAAAAQARAATSPGTTAPAATLTYRVRWGDSLWRIARTRLGSGVRYPEIYDASRGIRQRDGRHLRDPDAIDVGWTLRIPTTGTTAPPSHHAGTPPARETIRTGPGWSTCSSGSPRPGTGPGPRRGRGWNIS